MGDDLNILGTPPILSQESNTSISSSKSNESPLSQETTKQLLESDASSVPSDTNISPSPQETTDIFISEYLLPGDVRDYKEEFIAAKEREVKGLIDNNVYRIVKKESVEEGASILGGRFVLCI